MNLSLKYLIPLIIFFTGLFLVVIQTSIQMNREYARMIKNTSTQAKIVGNRLASRITFEIKSEGFSTQKMVSLSAPYMADTLDQIGLYDQRLNPLFVRYIPTHDHDHNESIESSIAYKVIKEQFSNIRYEHKYHHIIGYFPIDLPVREGEILSNRTGVIHLVFDVTSEYLQTKEAIIKTAIMNVAMIIIMVSFFSALMYYLIFKRLDALYRASLRLSQGDFDVHVNSKGHDELTQVIDTFNSMAVDMKAYKHTMQERVNKAVEERAEQSRLLIQQSRLASMGEMIGNIAHQWRQPLNALGLLIQKLELFSSRGKLTEEILKENVSTANHIIKNMSTTIDDFRDFFKPDKQKETFDLKVVVHEVMKLLGAGLEKADIAVMINISQPECQLYGFKNEFIQVIINLINNAKDALIERQVDNRLIHITGKQKKDGVIFSISDNAGGIPEAIIERIFEPYYTTKEEGQGTGIGLYMSKMIVEENMQGQLRVKNTNEGAEFSMIFKNSKGSKQ